MELFIPSLLAIIIAAAIVMFVLPRFSPIILGVVALVFLILAAYNHYSFFAYEYRQSTWQLPILTYAPFILLGVLVLFLLFFIINFIGTGATDLAAPMNSMNDAMNKVAEQVPTNITDAITQMKNIATNTMANVGLVGPQGQQGQQGQQANIRFSQV